MATPVSRVATSREVHSAPSARKKEYMVMVRVKINSRLMKNWDAVRARFDMLVLSVWPYSCLALFRGHAQVYNHVEYHYLDQHDRDICHHLG